MTYINMGLTLLTLIGLEIILGIDNVLFLSILTEKLPIEARQRARYWGLTFAWIARLFLLYFVFLLLGLNQALFVWMGTSFSVHSLFLLVGGFFLVMKAVQEIHFERIPASALPRNTHTTQSFWRVVLQVSLMDLVFSIDSVVTAVGVTSEFWMMALAISIAIVGMLYLSEAISLFIRAYPAMKMLGLYFLLFIGIFLVADGISIHIPREYLYVVLLFGLGIECFKILKKRRQKKITHK